MKKLAAAGLIAALLLIFAILLGTPLGTILSYRIRRPYPVNRDESVLLEGLRGDADAYFDEYGIPHIEAADAIDLARAVGFVQSRYRFFQLDVLRRFGQGRISELVGEQRILFSTTVEFDLAMRGWGFEERSRLDPEEIPELDREILAAFSDGVNQALDRYPPLEHAILGVAPEPWTPSDCLMVALVQAWSITHNWEQEAVRLSLALNLGLENADAIYPNDPIGGSATIASSGEPQELPPAIAPEIADLFPAGVDLERIARARRETGGYALGSLANPPSASTPGWWRVSAPDGMPILANDMHLSTLPSLLFLQRIKTLTRRRWGMTMLSLLPGGGTEGPGAASSVAGVVDLLVKGIERDGSSERGAPWLDDHRAVIGSATATAEAGFAPAHQRSLLNDMCGYPRGSWSRSVGLPVSAASDHHRQPVGDVRAARADADPGPVEHHRGRRGRPDRFWQHGIGAIRTPPGTFAVRAARAIQWAG
jgi:hypothetical protein